MDPSPLSVSPSSQPALFAKEEAEHQSTEAAGIQLFLSPSHRFLPLPPSRSGTLPAASVCFHPELTTWGG